ncbi:MAG: DEAD/DEAH box helicase family protein [Chloroflexi bacterium]|nr:DEAD/DEAH box helicase family protein [Chloroflexota bacterium]
MKQVVIENPILNSPYLEPTRHFKFSDEGITDEVVEGRRISSYFIPIPRPKKRNPKQLAFETEWTADRIQENAFINKVRGRVALWRQGRYTGVTSVTRRLLEYWQHPDREHRLFFCQIEALETAVYIAEVAGKFGDAWVENDLRRANEDANPLLYRIAFKMATGSGKTVVMAMLIAWHALNKLASPQDARFSDSFLIVTPGITIRDRLRVLLPNDPENYYRQHDVVPSDLLPELGKAKIIITNFHAFKPRERIAAGKITKDILKQGGASPFTETPDQMVRRVCRDLGNKKNIVVINDEAHHCYRRKPDGEEERLTGDERKEAVKREEEARIWISGLEAVKAKIGLKVAYDLSAPPFFLRGSGYSEGTLFPWVVSDFALIDAIESGVVKVPRVPVSDDSMVGEQPTYRDLWLRIRDDLPKKGRGTDALSGEPKLPVELEGALQSLYGNYEKYFRQWEQNADARSRGMTPPVFIVVCNNTNVSKLVYDYVAGWEKTLKNGTTAAVPGKLGRFSNVVDGSWTARPNAILIDSEQLESGEGMSDEFKKIAVREIEEFKQEYRARFPGRTAEDLSDEDMLREVMNTVGKPGKLGEQVKCVVSVSMLTEGWDANTVTHILGVRAFGTQLLCEQVVGRGLRRMSYATNADGMFEPQYAEVYGVPFSFIPCSGSAVDPRPGPTPTRVRALEERIACEITFPRVTGYRYELPSERLDVTFTQESQLAISPADLPTKTEMSSIIGEASLHTLYGLIDKREQEVDFRLASLVLEKYLRDDDGNAKPWLFPQLLHIAHRWRTECLTCKDNAFPQMLLLVAFANDAADRIYRAIVASRPEAKTIKPILRPYDPVGSTRYVDFDTTRPVYATDPRKCHISYAVADTESWEQKMAQALEEMDEVVCYVKNHNLGFTIPYTLNGEERGYIPDYIVHIDDGHGPDDLLNLILEVSGEARKNKAAKVATARSLWVPAINNHGGFGRWAFLEISDPWDAKNTIRKMKAAEDL